ncbi:hypothetical protein NW754_011137 [Fusarium falciforme]|nr:hypothetical protein NW754_011137 [Fusarium falciforme]
MAPIDYSKWDNIDTDSEPQTPTEQVPPVEANPAPAPATSQSTAPASTATPSASGSIQAVIVRCDVERLKFVPWSATTIQARSSHLLAARASRPRAHRGPAGPPPRWHSVRQPCRPRQPDRYVSQYRR